MWLLMSLLWIGFLVEGFLQWLREDPEWAFIAGVAIVLLILVGCERAG